MNCVYLYLLQKDTRTAAISVECQISCEKLGDIQMKLQLSECLSATNICEKKKKKCFPGVILFLCNTIVILTRLVFKLEDL